MYNNLTTKVMIFYTYYVTQKHIYYYFHFENFIYVIDIPSIASSHKVARPRQQRAQTDHCRYIGQYNARQRQEEYLQGRQRIGKVS